MEALSFTEKMQQKAETLKNTAKEKLGSADQRLRSQGDGKHGKANEPQSGKRLKEAGRNARDTFR